MNQPKMELGFHSMKEFTLLKFEYVELNKLLKVVNLVSSGGEAKQVIDKGLVKVNGQVETQRRKKIRIGDRVIYRDQEIVVEQREGFPNY